MFTRYVGVRTSYFILLLRTGRDLPVTDPQWLLVSAAFSSGRMAGVRMLISSLTYYVLRTRDSAPPLSNSLANPWRILGESYQVLVRYGLRLLGLQPLQLLLSSSLSLSQSP